MDKAALKAAVNASRSVTLSTFTRDEHDELVGDIITAYLAALPSPGEAEPVAWQPVEMRFHDIMGRFETPQQLAEGLRMSANYWRDRKPSDDAAQPRIMADFHERAAIAIERLLVSPPSEREVIEATAREDDIAAASILYQCADCLRAQADFSCYNRDDVFVIGKEVICRDCADAGHAGEHRRKVPDVAAKLKRQRMHASSQQRRAETAEAAIAALRASGGTP